MPHCPPGGRLEPFEYDPGQIGPHQVDVQVTHCGICHTDVAMVDNDFEFTQYPLVPGHEAVGVVAAVGPRSIGSASVSGSESDPCVDRV